MTIVLETGLLFKRRMLKQLRSPVIRFSLLMGNVIKDVVAFLLPISLGPTWLQVLAHLNPLYYVVEASRSLAAGSIGDMKVLSTFAVMIPLLAVTLSWATKVYRRAVA